MAIKLDKIKNIYELLNISGIFNKNHNENDI